MRNIQGGESLRFHKIHERDPFWREVNVPDRQIWENYVEVSRKVFWHFVIQEVWRYCKRRVMNSQSHEEISTIGCGEDTWQWIRKSGSQKSGGLCAR
jgi:hypothetical protein